MKQHSKPREEDRPVRVHISGGMLRVQLQYGREIATPLEWYPPKVTRAELERRLAARKADQDE